MMEDKSIIALARQMTTKLDLLRVLNIVKEKDLGTSKYAFSLRQLTYYCNPNIATNRYKSFQIPKKSKGYRTISAPCSGLKMLQTEINNLLKLIYHPSENVMGFVEGKSIVSNAECHLHKLYVLNIDLENFFPSIPQARVWARLKLPPFNFNVEIASTIAGICCMDVHEKVDGKDVIKNVLPQGAPTSPLLANAVCGKLDRKLLGLAKRFNLNYSRYADDITFSGNTYIYKEEGAFWKELRRIVAEQDFKINESKIRLQRKGQRQEVTGLTVGSKINVPKKYVRGIRSLLYIWRRYGYDTALKKFTYYYLADRRHTLKDGEVSMESVIEGKLDYLLMIKGCTDKVYKRLRKEFDDLSGKNIVLSPTEPSKFAPVVRTTSKAIHTRHMHSPEDIYNFMKNFSQGNLALKYTTHRWDKDEYGKFRWKDFDSFYKEYNKELENSEKHISLAQMFSYSEPLRNTIYNFLKPHTKKDRIWSKEYGIDVGYCFPEGAIEEWMKSHPDKEPYQMPLRALDEQYRPKGIIDGKVMSRFGDLINIFKQSIEFRDEGLYKLFKSIFEGVDYDIKEDDLENLKGYDIYTDTFTIKQALKKIEENINARTAHKSVKITTTKENHWLSIDITQVGSFSYRDINDDKIKKKGNLIYIKNMLQSLCDFSVISKFKDNGQEGSYQIDYLFDNNADLEPRCVKLSNEAEGFTYRLKFYIG